MEDFMREVLERVQVEREIDLAVKNFKLSEEYRKFQESEDSEHKLIVEYVDSTGAVCTTTVYIAKVIINNSSRMNKSRKYRKLKKLIEQEISRCAVNNVNKSHR